MQPISSVFKKCVIVDERECDSLKSCQDNNQVSMNTVATYHMRVQNNALIDMCSFASFKQILKRAIQVPFYTTINVPPLIGV